MLPFDEATAARWGAGITAGIGLLCLVWWFSVDPTAHMVEFHPGMDRSGEAAAAAGPVEVVTIGEHFQPADGTPADLPGSWTQFRGAARDNIATDPTPLAGRWLPGGPPQLWDVELGEGHAAPAIVDGKVFLLDYDEEQRADTLLCLSLGDGAEIWRRSYEVQLKRNHGLSRTVPAVSERWVVTMGPRCHVMAADAVSGDLLWGMDLERSFGSEAPFWYTGQCPLIDGDVVVLAPAGKTVLMMGVDVATGEVVWQTPNLRGWKMSHTSVMPMTFGGRRMYVYSAIGGMVAVAADGDDRGSVLWQTEAWSQSVLAPSPLQLPSDRIFVTAGYGAGSALLQVSWVQGAFAVEKLREWPPAEGLALEQQTAILYRDHLFGIQPKDAGALRQQLVCYRQDDPTALVWSSGKTERFGLGPFLVADGKLFVLNDDGVLTLLEASTSGYRVLDQAQVLDGHDAWGPIALAGGRMLVRDSTRMVCLDVSRAGNGGA